MIQAKSNAETIEGILKLHRTVSNIQFQRLDKALIECRFTIAQPIISSQEAANQCNSIAPEVKQPELQKRGSYCAIHNTFPEKHEPCYQCVNNVEKKAKEDIQYQLQKLLGFK